MEDQVPSTPTISFGDIVMNVFASPAEAFEGIRTSPARGSVWVVPLIVLFLLTIGYTYIMFTNETIKNQIIESQRERVQEQVQAGKITQERADQATQGMEQAGGMMMAFGIIGGIISVSLVFFVTALVFWLIGKFALKAEGGYGKYLELWGATQWIGALGFVIMILLVMAYNTMYASPSAALAVLSTYTPRDATHRLLSSLNVFSIWQMIVVGIGLSKFSGKPNGVGIGISIGVWIVWVLISVFALGAMFG
jgi:hypothetical protein